MKSSMNFKEALEKNTENIEVQSDLFQKIMKEIEGEEQMKLKQLKKTKTLIIACTALVISSATAFAAAKYIQYSTPLVHKKFVNKLDFPLNILNPLAMATAI